jgi:tetratricopeptide (TPR) repeat protein
MVRLKLGRNSEALDDANAAVRLDPLFVKAYYRKILALRRLGDFDRALDICNDNDIECTKNNKEIQQLAAEILIDKAKADNEKASLKQEAEDLSISRPLPVPTRVPLTTNVTSKAESCSASKEKEGSELRGYKKKDDGKVTTFFHMDISDEAKNLIGDIRPQKLEPAVAAEENNNVGSDVSAWNQAGTFESRSMKKWANEKVKTMFPLKIPINDHTMCLCDVPSLENDLEIICNRGKRRLINDLTFTVDWKLMEAEEKELGKGTIVLENDGEGDYTITVDVDPKTEPGIKPLVDTFIKSSGCDVQAQILRKVKELDEEFRRF